MVSRKPKQQPYGAIIKSGTVGSILSRLFQRILHNLGITPDRYEALMARYIQKATTLPDRKEGTSRVSLSKELLKKSMTWKTFLKGLEFLYVSKFEICLRLHNEEGKIFYCNKVVMMNQITMEGKILSEFYLDIMKAVGMTTDLYNELMIRYVNKACLTGSRKDRAGVRASLNKELLKPSMTWKTWIKGLVFLAITKVEVSLVLTHESRRITNHEDTILLDDFEEDYLRARDEHSEHEEQTS